MRIIFVVDDLKGGAFNACWLLIQRMKQQYSIRLVVLNKTVATRYNLDNTDVVMNNKKNKRLKGFFEDVSFIKKQVASFKPNVIISFLFGVSICSYFAIFKHKEIIFICSERSNPFVLKPPLLLRPFLSLAYHRADSIVVLFDFFVKAYPKRIQKKCCAIPNPVVKPEKFNHYNGGVKRIVTLGNNINYKGFDLIIDAIPFIKSNIDYHVEICGSFDKDLLQEKILKSNAKKHIKLKQYNPNIYEILDGAYAYLMVSRVEGFPNALVEGMSFGLPAIFYPCHNGIKEIVDTNKGIIVDSNSPECIGKAIDSALELKEEEYNLMCANSKQVFAKYDVDTIANKWIDLIIRCINRRQL